MPARMSIVMSEAVTRDGGRCWRSAARKRRAGAEY